MAPFEALLKAPARLGPGLSPELSCSQPQDKTCVNDCVITTVYGTLKTETLLTPWGGLLYNSFF